MILSLNRRGICRRPNLLCRGDRHHPPGQKLKPSAGWGRLGVDSCLVPAAEGCFLVTVMSFGFARETIYNRLWQLAVIGVPLLMGAAAAAWLAKVADQLPNPMAVQWNANGGVGTSTTLSFFALLTLLAGAVFGAVIGGLGVALRGQSPLLARAFMAAGLGGGTALVAMFVSMAAGRLGADTAATAQLSSPVMAVGLALAAVLAVLVFLFYRPGEKDSMAVAGPQAAMEQPLPHVPLEGILARAENGETLRIKVSVGRWKWPYVIGVGLIVAAACYVVVPILSLLGVICAAAVWVFCQGTVVIGPDGVKVLASGFRTVMPIAHADVSGVSANYVGVTFGGGLGYRWTGSVESFVVASGPALFIQVGSRHFIISMPDAKTAVLAASFVSVYQLLATTRSLDDDKRR